MNTKPNRRVSRAVAAAAAALAIAIGAAGVTPASAAGQADPGVYLDQIGYGNAHLLRRDHAAAVKSFTNATELAPGFAYAWAQLGVAYGRNGDARRAGVAITRAVALDPDDADIQRIASVHLLEQADARGAVLAAAAAVEAAPQPVASPYWLQYGTALVAAKQYAAAEEALRRALDAPGATRSAVWIKLADAAYRAGDYSRAVKTAQAGIADGASSVDIRLTLAYALMNRATGSDTAECRTILTALTKEAPSQRGVWYALGEFCRVEAEYEAALAAFDRVQSMGGRSPQLSRQRGSVLMQLERWDEAVAAYTHAATLEGPERGAVFQRLAEACREMGNPAAESEWRQRFREWQLAQPPTVLSGADARAVVVADLSHARALQQYSRGLQKALGYLKGTPDADDVRSAAIGLARRARDGRAMEALVRESLKRTDTAIRRMALGDALMLQGRAAEGEAAFRTALERDPVHAETLARLAHLAASRGEAATAADLANRALAGLPALARSRAPLLLILAHDRSRAGDLRESRRLLGIAFRHAAANQHDAILNALIASVRASGGDGAALGALRDLSAVCASRAQAVSLSMRISELEMASSQPDLALTWCVRASTVCDTGEPFVAVARMHAERGEAERAQAALRSAEARGAGESLAVALIRAQLALADGSASAARAALDAIRAAGTNSADWWALLGRCDAALGGDPVPSYRRARDLAPADAPVSNLLARALDAAGQRSAAAAERQRFAQAIRRGAALPAELRSRIEVAPAGVRGRLVLADELLARGDTEGARAVFDTATDAEFEIPALRDALGRVAVASGSFDAAIEDFAFAYAAGFRNAGSCRLAGNAASENGDTAAAVEWYRRALAIDPLEANARYNLGTALSRAGRNGEARAEFERIVREHPDYARMDYVRYNLANVLYDEGKADEAYIHAREAYRRNASDLSVVRRVWSALARDPRTGEVHARLRELEEIHPLGPGAAYIRARRVDVCLAGDRLPEAIALLNGLLADDPNNVTYWSQLIAAHGRSNDHEAALEAGREAVARVPGSGALHAGYGAALVRLMNVDAGRAELETAVKLTPTLGNAWVDLTRLYIQLELPDKAVAAGARAVELQPGLPTAWYLYASALRDAGEDAEAEAALKSFSTLTAENEAKVSAIRADLARQAAERAELEARRTETDAAIADAVRRSAASDHAGAAAACDRAAELSPSRADVWMEMARVWKRAADAGAGDPVTALHRAIDAWDAAVGTGDPRIAEEAFSGAAAAHLRLREFTSAIEKAERALVISAADGPLLTLIGDAAREAGDLDTARSRYQQSLQTGASAAAQYGLGAVEFLSGNREAAESSLRRALAARPNDPRTMRFLSMTLAGGSAAQRKEALSLLERAVAAAPDFGPAWIELARQRVAANDPRGASAARERADAITTARLKRFNAPAGPASVTVRAGGASTAVTLAAGELALLDTVSGAAVVRFRLPPGYGLGSDAATVTAESVVARANDAAGDEVLFVFDRASGALRWRTPVWRRLSLHVPIAGGCLLVAGVDADGTPTAGSFQLATGDAVWTAATPAWGTAGGLTVPRIETAHGQAWTVGSGGVAKIDLATGALAWTVELPGHGPSAVTLAPDADGALAILSQSASADGEPPADLMLTVVRAKGTVAWATPIAGADAFPSGWVSAYSPPGFARAGQLHRVVAWSADAIAVATGQRVAVWDRASGAPREGFALPAAPGAAGSSGLTGDGVAGWPLAWRGGFTWAEWGRALGRQNALTRPAMFPSGATEGSPWAVDWEPPPSGSLDTPPALIARFLVSGAERVLLFDRSDLHAFDPVAGTRAGTLTVRGGRVTSLQRSLADLYVMSPAGGPPLAVVYSGDEAVVADAAAMTERFRFTLANAGSSPWDSGLVVWSRELRAAE